MTARVMDVRPALRTAAFAAVGLAFLTSAPASAQGASSASPAVTTSIPLVFSGEVRTRTEWDAPGNVAADVFTYLRTRLGVRVDAAPGASLVLQVQDSRVLGTEGNAISGTTDVFDMHQGYLQLSGSWNALDLSARAGRQEISVANERLVGVANWQNAGRSFDGLRLIATPSGAKAGAEPWTATAFGAIVEEHGRRFGGGSATAAAVPDHAMAGAYVTVRRDASTIGELTLLYDGGLRYRSFADANRTTLDGRLRAVLGRVRLELEGAVQGGSQRALLADTTRSVSQQVRAWFGGVRVGLPVGSRVVATLGADMLSGDETPTDGRYSAFGTLFATNHQFYGLIDVIGDPAASTRERGLIDAFSMATATVSPNLAPRVELHRFTLATGESGLLGAEADVVAPLKLTTASTAEVGYAIFRAGRASPGIGLGADGSTRQWLYLQLRAGF